jgi:hypothetical protein
MIYGKAAGAVNWVAERNVKAVCSIPRHVRRTFKARGNKQTQAAITQIIRPEGAGSALRQTVLSAVQALNA